MKNTLLLCVAFALCSCGAGQLWAVPDPGDRFLEAYFLIQEGDSATRQGDWAKADAKFTGAMEILREIKADSPDWNPHIIEFRMKYIEDRIAELKPKLEQPPSAPVAPAPVPPAAPVPAPAPALPPTPPEPPSSPSVVESTNVPPAAVVAPLPTPSATPAETEQVRQLAAELQRARDQVQQLEAARDELNAKLQEQLSKVAPAQTTPQIEELLKTNQELAAKLAAAQTEIAQAREQVSTNAPAPPAPATEPDFIQQLRTELAAARGELQHTKEELQSTRQELGTTKQALEKAQVDNVELRRSYDDVAAQLTDANKKLASAHAASDKDDEIIRQLRKENALLRIITERKSLVAPAEPEDTIDGHAIPELRGWHPRPRPESTTKTPPKKEPVPPPSSPSAAEESSRGKLIAKLTAPKKADTSEPVSATSTSAPAAAPAPVKPAPEPAKTAPVKPAPAKPAPVKPATVKPTSAKPAAPTKAAPPEPKKEVAVVAQPTAKDKAQEKAESASSGSPDIRKQLNEARAALALKDFDTAAIKYDTVLKLEPDNIVALSNLGVIRYKQGRLDEAEQSLRKAVAAAPNDSSTRSLLGVIYFRKGLTEESFNELTRAVALDPRNAEAHNYLGIVLSEKGWGAAGEGEIRRAIELNPQYADAHFNLAVIYAKQRTPRLELARYHYKKALDMGAPPDPELEALLKKLSEKSVEPVEPKAEEAPKK